MEVKLSFPLLLSDILTQVNGTARSIDTNKIITHVTTDSRECNGGSLFFALGNENKCKNEYLQQAIYKGATVITDRSVNQGITVKSVTKALLSVGALYREGLPQLKGTVGITGSVGKTTTKNILSEILSKIIPTHATYRNYNNEIGVPLSVLGAKRDTEALVLEIGMNHAGEIESIVDCIYPDIAIITNVGTSHIGNLGSKEAIARAKWEIASNENTKLTLCEKAVSRYNPGKICATVGVNEIADFSLMIKKTDIGFTDFTFYYPGGYADYKRVPVQGKHVVYSIAFCLSAVYSMGFDPRHVDIGISNRSVGNNSGSFIELNEYTLYDDSYNSSPESVIADIEMLMLYKRPVSVALGDILELGSHSDKIHRELGKAIAGLGIKKLYLFGMAAKEIGLGALAEGFPSERIFHNSDTSAPELTAAQIHTEHGDNEIILLKASNKIGIGRVGQILKEKEVPT